jgi:hypothetical protein
MQIPFINDKPRNQPETEEMLTPDVDDGEVNNKSFFARAGTLKLTFSMETKNPYFSAIIRRTIYKHNEEFRRFFQTQKVLGPTG